MPKISVIVPVYNTEKYLPRCIDSILVQTFTDFELLLIDDGSTDSSSAICDEYAEKDNRVRVFHKPNGGVSSARNMGLDNAQGEWISFVDSDDYTDSYFLENFELYIYRDKIDLICQGFKTDKPLHSNLSSTEYGIHLNTNIRNGINKLSENNILGFLWNKLFHTSIISKYKLRFNEEIKLREDEIFVLQYAIYCKTLIHSKKIGYYYQVPNWNKYVKHDVKHDELLYKTLYTLILQFYSKETIYIYKKYLSQLVDFYFTHIVENDKNKIRYTKELRQIIKKNFWETPLFFITRIVILLDPSTIISRKLILLHYNYKLYIHST